MMRLLFLAPFGRCRRGTVVRRWLPLARALAARGHEVAALIPAWDCPDEVGAQSSVIGEGVMTVIMPALGPGARGVYPLLTERLKQAVAEFAPDVLMVSKGLGYAGWAGWWWLKQHGRVVLDVDDLETAWHKELGRNSLLARWLAHQEARLVRDAHGVTAASRFLLDYWGEARSSQPANVPALYYLPNGLTPATSPAPVAHNPPHALLMTRGHDVDVGMLARVWAQVSARIPQARLLIAGGWLPPYDLPQTRVLGWLSPSDYIQAIRGAAVCLFLPQKKPLVQAKSPARVLDCLAQGMPVVTLDVGEYGALARAVGATPLKDETALAARLQRLLNDAQARNRAGQEVFAGMPALSWDRRAAGLEAWLSQIKRWPSPDPLRPRLRSTDRR